jgi:hypothetical protein
VKRNDAQSPAATLSKPEAVWRAIEELGYQAPVTEILEYVKNRFGIDADSPAESPEPAAPAEPALQADRPPPAPLPAAPKPAAQRKPRARNESEG